MIGGMDRSTVAVYEDRGLEWAAGKRPVRRPAARAFATAVRTGGWRADLGCGAGRYTPDLGAPVVALDASATMLAACRAEAPRAPLVRADLEALPLRRGVLDGAWANMSYQHLPRVRVPLALADLHRACAVGARLDVQVLAGDYEGRALPDDRVGGRYFAGWSSDQLVDVLAGAGFVVEQVEVEGDEVRARAVRDRTLADTVGAGMRLLVCGLNPSVYSADAGVGFARPGNRFWPAALGAGLVTRDRDARHALVAHGIGMTDLVKRATSRAAELDRDEYRAGVERVGRLVEWLAPTAVCCVGLAGWRAAVDRRARAGWQLRPLGGRPVYVMPSTSGLNARTPLDALVDHLRAAAAGPP